MRIKLKKSLKNDEILFKIIKTKLITSKESYFNFKVNISKKKYINMIKNRYISCLLNMPIKNLSKGRTSLFIYIIWKYEVKNPETSNEHRGGKLQHTAKLYSSTTACCY